MYKALVEIDAEIARLNLKLENEKSVKKQSQIYLRIVAFKMVLSFLKTTS